jgi:hypothetical protein
VYYGESIVTNVRRGLGVFNADCARKSRTILVYVPRNQEHFSWSVRQADVVIQPCTAVSVLHRRKFDFVQSASLTSTPDIHIRTN